MDTSESFFEFPKRMPTIRYQGRAVPTISSLFLFIAIRTRVGNVRTKEKTQRATVTGGNLCEIRYKELVIRENTSVISGKRKIIAE